MFLFSELEWKISSHANRWCFTTRVLYTFPDAISAGAQDAHRTWVFCVGVKLDQVLCSNSAEKHSEHVLSICADPMHTWSIWMSAPVYVCNALIVSPFLPMTRPTYNSDTTKPLGQLGTIPRYNVLDNNKALPLPWDRPTRLCSCGSGRDQGQVQSLQLLHPNRGRRLSPFL